MVGSHLLFGELCGVNFGVVDTGTGLYNFGECTFLEVRGTLDGGYQLRYQVGTALVDVLHLSPCFLHVFVSGDELVVHADAPHD